MFAKEESKRHIKGGKTRKKKENKETIKSSSYVRDQGDDEDRHDGSYLMMLSDEILVWILNFVGWREYGRLACMNRRLHRISLSPELWKKEYMVAFSGWYSSCPELTEMEISWRDKVKSCSLERRVVSWQPVPTRGSKILRLFGKKKNQEKEKEAEKEVKRGESAWDAVDPAVPFKIFLAGTASGVGISAMAQRFVSNRYINKYDPTIEDSYLKRVSIKGKTVTLDIMDATASEEYRALGDQYLKSSEAFLLVYSVRYRRCFELVERTYQRILRVKGWSAEYQLPIILVGHLCDTEQSEREVTYEEGAALADKLGIPFMEASAKANINIRQCFEDLVLLCAECRQSGLFSLDTPGKKEKRNHILLQSTNGSTYQGRLNKEKEGSLPHGPGTAIFSIDDAPCFERYEGTWHRGMPRLVGTFTLRAVEAAGGGEEVVRYEASWKGNPEEVPVTLKNL